MNDTFKQKTFDEMIDMGWNLGDNDYESFNNTLNIDWDTLSIAYESLDESVERHLPLAYTTEQLEDLRDAIGFIMDYVDCTGLVDKEYLPIKKNI